MNERLVAVSELLNIRQTDISALCQIGRSTVNEWYKGKRKIPSKHLNSICQEYHIEPNMMNSNLPLSEKEKLEVFKGFIKSKTGNKVKILVQK